ncbi:cupin-like domain-containing protein, partial [Singulisphaera rosea]
NTGRVSSNLDGRTLPHDPVVPLGRPQILECLLEPGELLFLPVGCWSFAETFEPSATLSFTNFAFDNDFGDFRISARGV